MLFAFLATGCSTGSDVVVTVDDVELPAANLNELHAAPGELDEDQRVGGALVLILHEAFSARAQSELGITPSGPELEAAIESQRLGLDGEQLAELLEARNETETRLRLNAELDTIRDLVAAELVRSESDGFDLTAAERAFSMANAEICIRQIQLGDEENAADVLVRLDAGEPFADVARELSVDPFVSLEDGVGAGGDLGCSAPNALPVGLDEAAIDLPLNQPSGPVASSVGVHVVEIYQRTEPDLVLLHDQVVEAAVLEQGPELFRQWAVGVLLDIDVEVDESIGRWAVLPETAPVPTVVPPYRFSDIIDG